MWHFDDTTTSQCCNDQRRIAALTTLYSAKDNVVHLGETHTAETKLSPKSRISRGTLFTRAETNQMEPSTHTRQKNKQNSSQRNRGPKKRIQGNTTEERTVSQSVEVKGHFGDQCPNNGISFCWIVVTFHDVYIMRMAGPISSHLPLP